MQNWAKRGMQTALVTGGLLMLGTGIAAADEHVDPDAKPSPLDGGVSVPVKLGNWNIGTPFGEKHVDVFVDKTITTGDALKDGSAKAAPYMKGNVLAPNALVPVEGTGWAVAAGGEAHNVNQSSETHAQGSGVETTGEGEGLAGNVVAPTAVVPAQVTGIAFPLLGTATVENTTDQDSTAGGEVVTDGDDGAGSGNIVAPQAAVPLAVNNTAAGWFAGVAKVDGDSTQTASAPGGRETSGDDSVLGGNLATAPIAGPAQVDGTAASWGGKATNESVNTAAASAGTAGSDRTADYATTSGDSSVAGGNLASPQAAPLATVDCTAGAWGGISTSSCTDDHSTVSGGDVATSGDDAVLGGNVADVPAAVPATVDYTAGAWGGKADVLSGNSTTEAIAGGTAESAGDSSVLGGNVAGAPAAAPASVDCTAGAWGGDVSSTCEESTTAEAGNAPELADYATTAGDDSVGGGNVVTAQPNPLAAVDCTAGVWGGMSTTDCVNDTTSAAGGGTETTGDTSTLGGNIVDADAAVPAEGYSNAGAFIGDSEATGTKTVLTDAGGMADTSGEDSTGGGNTLRPKLAAPTGVDCNAGVLGGASTSTCETATEAESGGDTHSNGDDSILGGNNGEAPVSPVSSVGCNAGGAVGTGTTDCVTDTTSEAGGFTFTQGDESIGGGNQVLTPAASAEDVTCVAAGGIGTAECVDDNDVDSSSGGYNGTTGNDSTGAGNVITTPTAPVGELFGAAGAAGGDATSTYTEDKDVSAGGDSQTNDDRGTVSSNIAAVPLAPAAQVSNIAGAFVGKPTSIVEGDTKNTAGGDVEASANESNLSGNIAEAPIALPADVHTLTGTVVGNGLADGTHNTESTAGGDATTTSVGSPGSGNIVGAQGAGAANVYGWAAGAAANNLSTSDKTLSSTAGGDTTSNGDTGSISGNQVLANGNAVGGVFGNAGSLVANDTADTVSATDVTSGGDAVASGDAGNIAGNVAQADAQPLAQVFGLNPAAGGTTANTVDTTTDATNGGTVDASGMGGNLAGNIADADAQAPWQAFGLEAAALGSPVNTVMHDTTATNSGTNTTNGDAGNLAGNVVNGDAQAPAQLWGLDGSVAGNAVNTVDGMTAATNGGTTEASGVGGSGSGNIIAAQGQSVPQVLGWGAGVFGTAAQGTTSETSAANGGDNTTAGTGGQFSGYILDPVVTANPAAHAWAGSLAGNVTNITDNSFDAANGGTDTSVGGEVLQIPIGLAPQLNEVVIPIGGQITNVFTNDSNQMIADGSVMGMDATDGLMPASGLPSLPGGIGRTGRSDVPPLPVGQTDAAEVPLLNSLDGLGLPVGMAQLPAAPEVGSLPVNGALPALPSLPSGFGRSDLPSLPGVPALPQLPQVSDPTGLGFLEGIPGVNTGLPALPSLPDSSGLPELGGLPQAGSLPVDVTQQLPAIPSGFGRSDLPSLPGLDMFGGLPIDQLQDTVTLPALGGGMPSLPGLPSAPEVGGLPGMPELPGVGGTLPTPRDLPTAQQAYVPGVSEGMAAFEQNMQMPTDAPLTPQLDAGQVNLPDAGVLSGQLPLGDISVLDQTPALSSLETAQLTGLLSGLPTR